MLRIMHMMGVGPLLRSRPSPPTRFARCGARTQTGQRVHGRMDGSGLRV